jgi:hypothetical protein
MVQDSLLKIWQNFNWTTFGSFVATGLNKASVDIYYPAEDGGNFTANVETNVTLAIDFTKKRFYLNDKHLSLTILNNTAYLHPIGFTPNACYIFNFTFDQYLGSYNNRFSIIQRVTHIQ